MGKKEEGYRVRAHNRLFSALGAARDPFGLNAAVASEPLHESVDTGKSEDISADEYYAVAKKVIEAQKEILKTGGELDIPGIRNAIKALHYAKASYQQNDSNSAQQASVDELIVQAKTLIQSSVTKEKEKELCESAVCKPHLLGK